MLHGGFGLALVNCTDFDAGLKAREMLANAFKDCELIIPIELSLPHSLHCCPVKENEYTLRSCLSPNCHYRTCSGNPWLRWT
jgi:hypothetical protein